MAFYVLPAQLYTEEENSQVRFFALVLQQLSAEGLLMDPDKELKTFIL